MAPSARRSGPSKLASRPWNIKYTPDESGWRKWKCCTFYSWLLSKWACTSSARFGSTSPKLCARLFLWGWDGLMQPLRGIQNQVSLPVLCIGKRSSGLFCSAPVRHYVPLPGGRKPPALTRHQERKAPILGMRRSCTATWPPRDAWARSRGRRGCCSRALRACMTARRTCSPHCPRTPRHSRCVSKTGFSCARWQSAGRNV